MDSRGWLVALGALAVALLTALWLTRPGEPVRGGGRVLPDLDVRRVEAILLQAHESEGVTLERDGERWEIKDRFATVPADPAAVRDLLGTLEMLAVQRRDDGAVDPSLGVTIMRKDAPAVKLFFEATGGATDRVWASRGGEAGRFLVDGYAVRALNVSAAELRETRPLRGRLAGAQAIAITAGDRKVELTGPPWRLASGTRVDPAELRALEDELDRLRMTSSGKTATGSRSAQILIEGQGSAASLELGGACAAGDGVAVLRSPIGAGCVAADAIDAILRRADAHGPLVDRRPLAARPDEIDALHLRRGARAVTATRAEQPEALRVWLDAVARAPTGEVADASGFAPEVQVSVELAAGGSEAFAVGRAAGSLALRRADEPVVLLLAPASAELFDPAPHRFRSLDLIARDPTDLASAAREGESISRGETLEEWRALRPAGAAVDAAAAARLADAVATLRATRVVAARAEPRHGLGRRAVELSFDPPPGAGAPERHRVDLGAATDAGGCYARLDRDPVVFELPSDRCAALTAPWTTGARSPR